MDNSQLPSDKTYEKYKEQYELYKYAHNGYPQYLSYELYWYETELKKTKQQLEEAVELLSAIAPITTPKSPINQFLSKIKV
jgi:hypothetical protein